MLALLATVIISLYFIIPHALLRYTFGLFVPLRSFVQSRLEELNETLIALGVTALIVWALVWFIPPFTAHPFRFRDTAALRRADYKLVYLGVTDDSVLRANESQFWFAVTRTTRRQGRFLFWYYWVVVSEGLLFGGLSRYYGRLARSSGQELYRRGYRFFADHFLLPNISPWHALLTNFTFEDKRTRVMADVLCEGTLYTGTVATHFLDKDGKLSELFITDPKRFDRPRYLKDCAEGKNPDPQNYWRPIPSARLLVPAAKISNMNVRYDAPPSPGIIERILSKDLEKVNIKVTIAPPKE